MRLLPQGSGVGSKDAQPPDRRDRPHVQVRMRRADLVRRKEVSRLSWRPLSFSPFLVRMHPFVRHDLLRLGHMCTGGEYRGVRQDRHFNAARRLSRNETDFLDALTYRALVRFQNAHPNEILCPLRLTVGNGFFGPSMRAFVNSLDFVGASSDH
jgi:hypothetical protein